MARDPAGWSRSTSGVVPTDRPLSNTRAPDGSELTINAPRNGRVVDEAVADGARAGDPLVGEFVADDLGVGAIGRGALAAVTEVARAAGSGRTPAA